MPDRTPGHPTAPTADQGAAAGDAAAHGFHAYVPSQGHGLRHDPLSAIIGPRVIGWIGTQSAAGCRNLAPYSFSTMLNYRPPILCFSSVGAKHSLRNATETGVFTWNLATRALAEPMNQSSTMQDVDEFALTGLTPIAGTHVAAPRVLESPVSLECRVSQQVRLAGADGTEVDTWLVMGEIVAVHIRRDCLEDGIYRTTAAEPILRGGGAADYFTITEAARFGMRRPD